MDSLLLSVMPRNFFCMRSASDLDDGRSSSPAAPAAPEGTSSSESELIVQKRGEKEVGGERERERYRWGEGFQIGAVLMYCFG